MGIAEMTAGVPELVEDIGRFHLAVDFARIGFMLHAVDGMGNQPGGIDDESVHHGVGSQGKGCRIGWPVLQRGADGECAD